MTKTVIVVDDDPIMLQSYEAILKEAGRTVITRQDGQSALTDIHGGLRVDLVITDYRMPGMDGLELVTQLKRLAPQVPVIMCSLYMRSDVYVKGLSLGIVAYLEKPFGPNELNRVVAMALETPAREPDGPGASG